MEDSPQVCATYRAECIVESFTSESFDGTTVLVLCIQTVASGLMQSFFLWEQIIYITLVSTLLPFSLV